MSERTRWWDNRYRLTGLLLVGANVIPGIILYAALAVLIGEDRLETESGLTALGTVATFAPMVVGVIILAFSGPLWERLPVRSEQVGLGVTVVGVVLLFLGALALVTAPQGDANIGAGLLVLVSTGLVVGGGWVVVRGKT